MHHGSIHVVAFGSLWLVATVPAWPQADSLPPAGRSNMTPGESTTSCEVRADDQLSVGCRSPVGCIRRIAPDSSSFSANDEPERSVLRPALQDGIVAGAPYVLDLHGVQTRLDTYMGLASGCHVFKSSTAEPSLRAWFRPATNQWIVADRSGFKYIFGHRPVPSLADSGIEAANELVEWGLSSVDDAYGNRVSVTALAAPGLGDGGAAAHPREAQAGRATGPTASDRPQLGSSR